MLYAPSFKNSDAATYKAEPFPKSLAAILAVCPCMSEQCLSSTSAQKKPFSAINMAITLMRHAVVSKNQSQVTQVTVYILNHGAWLLLKPWLLQERLN